MQLSRLIETPEQFFRAGLASVSLVILLAGCSVGADPNDASEENFRSVLEPQVAKLACTALPVEDANVLAKRGPEVNVGDLYPLIGGIGYGFNFASGEWVEGGVFAGDPGPEDTYRKLSELGALDRKETAVEYSDEQMPFGRGTSRRPQKYAIYTPKDEFKELFSSVTRKTLNGQTVEAPALCYGVGKITSIQFSIPAEGESKSSRVEYTWSAEPLSNAARQLYDQDVPLLGRPPLSGKGNAVLVLTNNGWQQMGLN